MGEVALMIEQQKGSDKIREWAKKTSLHGEKPLYAEFVVHCRRERKEKRHRASTTANVTLRPYLEQQ